MNSALQCLVHCQELTEYFLSQVYKTELNEVNPLGSEGNLAKAYFYLTTALFNPAFQKPAFPPSEFKKVLGRFAPAFGGYGQQDSQEFLEFLLDGLHEDLNRVRNKPYVEREELVGVTPSEEQLRVSGEKSWKGHKLRNDSVIVDLCQGLYKSTVVCPVCEVVSVTFDPFMDLSVPLPIKQMYFPAKRRADLDGNIRRSCLFLGREEWSRCLLSYQRVPLLKTSRGLWGKG
jgi:ubiquitin carboxyl-terminal hydrolase 4/11